MRITAVKLVKGALPQGKRTSRTRKPIWLVALVAVVAIAQTARCDETDDVQQPSDFLAQDGEQLALMAPPRERIASNAISCCRACVFSSSCGDLPCARVVTRCFGVTPEGAGKERHRNATGTGIEKPCPVARGFK